MDPYEKLLQDFYKKRGKPALTPEQVQKIRQTYGEDYDALLRDLYKKHAPDKMPDSAKMAEIKSIYGLSAAETPADLSVLDYAGHVAGQVNKGLINTTGGMLKGIGEITTPVGNPENNPIYMAGQGIEDLGAKYVEQTNPELANKTGAAGWALNTLPQGVGSAESFGLTLGLGASRAAAEIPQLSGQVMSAGRQLGQSALEGIKSLASPTGTLGGAAAVDETYQEALRAGMAPKDAIVAGLHNYLGGATEAAPLEHMLGRFAKLTGKSVADIGKQMLTGGVEESLQEGLQKYWQNQVAKGNYDPARDPMMGVLEDAGTAFVVGMAIPAAMHGLSGVGNIQDKIINRLQNGKPADAASAFDRAAPDTGDPDLNTTIDQLAVEVSNSIKELSSRKSKKKTEELVEKAKEDKDITGDLEEPLSKQEAAYEARMEAMANKINQNKENAVSKRSSEEIPVGEQTTPGGEVGTRVPGPEESTGTQGIQQEASETGQAQGGQTEVSPTQGQEVAPTRRRGKRGPVRDLTKPVITPEQTVQDTNLAAEDTQNINPVVPGREKLAESFAKMDEEQAKEKEQKKKIEAVEKEVVPEKLADERIKGEESLNKIKKESPKKQKDRLSKFIETYAEYPALVKAAQKQLKRLQTEAEEKAALKERKAAKAKMEAEDKAAQEEHEPTKEDLENEDKNLRDLLGEEGYSPDDVDYARSPGKLPPVRNSEGAAVGYTSSRSATDMLSTMKLKRKDLKEISIDEFVASLPDTPLRNVVEAMMKVLKGYRGKKSNLRILTIPKAKIAEHGTIGGFIATKAESKSGIMVVPEMSGDTMYVNTHELVHDYTLMMARFLYQNDPRFGEEINKIFKNGFVNFFNSLKKGIQADLKSILENNAEHTPAGPYLAFLRYLQSENILKGWEQYLSKSNEPLNKLTRAAISRVYGFTNPKEMLAEAFSNPNFMQLLASIPATRENARTVTSNKEDSLLYKLYKAITEFFKTTLKEQQFEGPSIFRDLMNTVTYYDLKFKEGNLQEAILEDPIWDTYHKGNVMSAESKNTAQPAGYNRGIVNKIVDSLESREDINTREDISKLLDSINKNLETPLGKEYVNYIDKALTKRHEQLAEVELLITDAFATVVDDEYYTGNASFKNLVDKAFYVDYKKLNKKDRNAYKNGIIELVSHKVPGKEFFDVTEKFEANERVERLSNGKHKFADIHSGILKTIIREGANPATISSIIGKYNKKAAQALFTELYGNMLHMSTQAEVAAKKFMDKLYAVAKRHKTSAVDHTRTQMYGAAYATKEAPDSEGYWEEIELNLDKIIDHTNDKLTAVTSGTWKEQSKKEVEKELEIAKGLKKDILEKKEKAGDDKVLTPGQRELYRVFREFAEEQKDAILLNTQGVWGADTFQPLHNYMPTSAIGKIRKGSNVATQIEDSDIIDNGEQNLTSALTRPDYGQIMASRSGFTKAKTQPKGYFYDYNLLSVATKWSKSILFDTNMSHEVKVLNRMLNHSTKMVDTLGQNNIEIFNTQIKGILGAGRKYSAEALRQWRGVFKFVDNYTEALMTASGQIVTQLSSAIPAAMIVRPKGFLKAVAVLARIERGELNGESLNDWMDRVGMGIQTRDIQFEKFQTVEGFNKAGLGRHFTDLTGRARAINSYILRGSDKTGARLVWLSAFFDAGGTFENPTKEAVLEAERAVGLLQNMSNMTFSANVFKSTNVDRRIILKMFYNFKAFALNAGLNTYGSGMNLFNKDADEAKQVFAASLAMTLAYEASYELLVKPVYEGIANALLGGDGGDDDDKRYGKGERILTKAIWDAILGQLLPDIANSLFSYGYNQTMGPSIHKHNDEKFDQYLDSPIYSKKTFLEALGEGTGAVGSGLLGGGMHAAVGLYPLVQMYLDEEAAEENPNNTEEKIDDAWLEAAGIVIAEATIIPLRGDLRKFIDTYRRKQKGLIREEKTAGNGAVGGGGVHTRVPHPIRNNSIRHNVNRQQIPSRTR